MSKKRNYTVGHGRPPEDGKFQPGKSGNHKGRPRGSKNLSTIMQEEMRRRVGVVENGKQKRIPKARAAAVQLSNAAAKGDLKAIMAAEKFLRASEEQSTDRQDSVFDTADHVATIENIVRRIRAMDPPTDPQPSNGNNAENAQAAFSDAPTTENEP